MGYEGLAMVQDGAIKNTTLTKAYSDFNSSAPFFQGFSLGGTYYKNWSYYSASFSWNRAKFNNESTSLLLSELIKTKFKVNTVSHDFGINLTRKKIILSSGIGLGVTTYKEKIWRNQITSCQLDGGAKVYNYSFEQTGKNKTQSFDIRFFLNLLMLKKQDSNISFNIKPFISMPISKKVFEPRIFFLGTNLSIGFS